MPGRSAAMTAMTAATIDQLSNGRMILGIGSSGPQVSEGWHGVRFAKQLARTRDYVAVLRMALARERVEYHGETLELPLPDGPGKALKLTIGTVQERIPIFIAAIGPKNTQLAGEIADGVIPTLFSPEHVAIMRDELQVGIDRARQRQDARRRRDRARACRCTSARTRRRRATSCARSSPSTSAAWARASRTSTTSSSSATGSRTPRKEVQDLYLDGKKDEAAAALPAELIDAVSLCGTPDQVRDRLAAYRDAGVGTLGVTPMAWTKEDRITQLRLVAELNAA